ncbi:MAG: helix-turn-helix domain-containing protein [Candidatus Moranbacteria bacterium]|nr:helix-turn-helix domain-containing protein [Candidatus Moranbacteria bacterium]
MTLEKQLHQIGFNGKEAKVYLACLQLGQDTAFHIAEKCGLKRSTVYFVLNELIERGLVSIWKTKKATLYRAANPKKLFTQLKRKEETLSEIFPLLQSIYNFDEDKPNIEVFEGREGVRQIYAEVVEYLSKGKEIMCWGDVSHIWDILEDVTDKYLAQARNRRYKIREILNKAEENKKYVISIRRNRNPNHGIRFLPENSQFAGNDNIIFGDKLVIFSTQNKLFATVIQSQDISNTYRNLFELAWQKARE